MEQEISKLREYLNQSRQVNHRLMENQKQLVSLNEELRNQISSFEKQINQLESERDKLRLQYQTVCQELKITKELTRNRDIEITSLQRQLDVLHSKQSPLKVVEEESIIQTSIERPSVYSQDEVLTKQPTISRFQRPQTQQISTSPLGGGRYQQVQPSMIPIEQIIEDQDDNALTSSIYMKSSVSPIDIKRATNSLRRSAVIDDIMFSFVEAFFIVNQHKKNQQIINKPEIKFAYPQDKVSKELREQLADFTFPTECSQNEPMLNTAEKILKQSILVDKHCHMFILDPTKASGAKIDNKLIQEINPNQHLYAFCVEFDDFLGDPNQPTKINKYQNVRQAFVILSFLPFFKYFTILLSSIINLDFIKQKRVGVLNQMAHQNMYDICMVDANFNLKSLELITTLLDKIRLQELPSEIAESYPILHSTYRMNPRLPKQLYLFECCPLDIFKGWNVSQFIAVFVAVLTEHKVIFVSEKRNVTAFTLLFFIQSILPFKYPHPVLLSVPESLEPLIDAPIPLILGISNYMDIETDELVIFRKSVVKLKNHRPHQSRFVQNLEDKIKSNIASLNQGKLSHEFVQENLLAILQRTKEFIESQIISYLPKHPIYKSNKRNLDYDALRFAFKTNRQYSDNFLEEFVETQLFQVYIDQYY